MWACTFSPLPPPEFDLSLKQHGGPLPSHVWPTRHQPLKYGKALATYKACFVLKFTITEHAPLLGSYSQAVSADEVCQVLNLVWFVPSKSEPASQFGVDSGSHKLSDSVQKRKMEYHWSNGCSRFKASKKIGNQKSITVCSIVYWITEGTENTLPYCTPEKLQSCQSSNLFFIPACMWCLSHSINPLICKSGLFHTCRR